MLMFFLKAKFINVMLEQKPNSEPKDETLDSLSPNSTNTIVSGSPSLSPDDSANGVWDKFNVGSQVYPLQPKTIAAIRDAALKFKEGNPVWAETCNNLAKNAQLFLAGYGPSEEVLKYSKPEIGFL